MPDGMLFSIPVYEGESHREVIKFYVDSWCKNTICNPEKFDHFVIKDRCPKCGGELRGCDSYGYSYIWCTNHPDCNYRETKSNEKKTF